MPGVRESGDNDSGFAFEKHTDWVTSVLVLVQGLQKVSKSSDFPLGAVSI